MIFYVIASLWVFGICYLIEKEVDKPQDFRSNFGVPDKVSTPMLAILSVIPLVHIALLFFYILHFLDMKGIIKDD